MSNPGVVTLSSIRTNIGPFRVEDNIGEAIHLHLGEFRYDLSIKELLLLSNEIEQAVQEMMKKVPGFNISQISKEFFLQKSDCWSDLVEVRMERIHLNDLLVDTYENGKFGFYSLEHSRVLKALNGNNEENDRRNERNYFGQSNRDRVDAMLESIKQNGYPKDNQYIIVFNDENIIADGQHRAACLYYLYGNIEVDILRMFFVDGKHNNFVPRKKMKQKLFVWNKQRIKAYMIRFIEFLYNSKRKVDHKRLSLRIRKDKKKYLKRRQNHYDKKI